MSYDQNRANILSHSNKALYLFDSGVFVRLEEIQSLCGIDFISEFKQLPNEHFFISNEVMVEIANGPRNLNFEYFLNHILKVEGGMDPDWKENRFLIEENGEIKFIELNKISSVDYMQVLLCQNHHELVLVSNDRKLLKSAVQVMPGRVLGMPVLIKRLSDKYSTNKNLAKIVEAVETLYSLKSSFDKSKIVNSLKDL